MPRGLPDYFNPDTIVSQRLANVEEVVTAIQGLANLDNRGKTFYYTHFGEGVDDWRTVKSADGVLPVPSTTYALVAPASLKLDAGTDSGSGISYVQKSIHLNNMKSAGVEISYGHWEDSPKLAVELSYDNGTNRVKGTFYIDQVAGTVTINDGGSEVTILTLPTAKTGVRFIPFKMVIDFDTLAYVRFLAGLDQYDISEYTLPTSATDETGLLRVYIRATPLDDGTNIAYIGHVAITIDEP